MHFYCLCLWEMGKGEKSTVELLEVSLLHKTAPCCFYCHWASGRWSKIILACFHVILCLFVIVLHSKVGVFFVLSVACKLRIEISEQCKSAVWASGLDLLSGLQQSLWMSVSFSAKRVRGGGFRQNHLLKFYCHSWRGTGEVGVMAPSQAL